MIAANVKNGKVTAPFTAEQVLCLNAFQGKGDWHPFTCGSGRRTDADHKDGEGKLVAHLDGWRCPYCKYRQTWAHETMLILGAKLVVAEAEKEMQILAMVEDTEGDGGAGVSFRLPPVQSEAGELLTAGGFVFVFRPGFGRGEPDKVQESDWHDAAALTRLVGEAVASGRWAHLIRGEFEEVAKLREAAE